MNEDVLISKNEAIEKAAYSLYCALLGVNPKELETERRFPKDAEQINEIISMTEDFLKRSGYPVCRPFFACDEIICSKSDDRCEYCPYERESTESEPQCDEKENCQFYQRGLCSGYFD